MNDRKQDAETKEVAEKIAEDKEFLGEAGFIKTPTDGNLNPAKMGILFLLDQYGNLILDQYGQPIVEDTGRSDG
jgi:hypothetical protein